MKTSDNISAHLLVSIVIPMYNAAFFVEATIQSALQQTYPFIEVILVDDGSTDDSYQKAKQYENDKVTVVTQPNSGASAARNRGIRLAKGDFIQFLDADDLLHPQKIEHQVQTAHTYSNEYLIGGTWQRFVNDLSGIFGEIRPLEKIDTELHCFDKVQWLINRPMMIPNTWLVPRKLVEAAGPWDENISLNDDGEYFYRVIAAAKGVVIDRRAATYYRSFNNLSLSSTWGRKAMLSWIKSIQSYKAILTPLAGSKGHESVDRFFYQIAYWCLNEFPDLVALCKKEMYEPSKTYPLEDPLINKLAGKIGLAQAKRVRTAVNIVKYNRLVRKIINKIKDYRGKPAY